MDHAHLTIQAIRILEIDSTIHDSMVSWLGIRANYLSRMAMSRRATGAESIPSGFAEALLDDMKCLQGPKARKVQHFWDPHSCLPHITYPTQYPHQLAISTEWLGI
jgi:hypothetical protein